MCDVLCFLKRGSKQKYNRRVLAVSLNVVKMQLHLRINKKKKKKLQKNTIFFFFFLREVIGISFEISYGFDNVADTLPAPQAGKFLLYIRGNGSLGIRMYVVKHAVSGVLHTKKSIFLTKKTFGLTFNQIMILLDWLVKNV